ncbi:MAG: hypothetical protein IPP56_15795 [Bacteroidetes bacterium]|nr:hypothetical protein [Bacteroidota bacterium]
MLLIPNAEVQQKGGYSVPHHHCKKNIKALTVNTVKEIKERGFEEAPTEQSTLPHFVLQLLRQHLTILFFDIQELSKASIDSPTGIEDFYLLDLNLPKAQIKS